MSSRGLPLHADTNVAFVAAALLGGGIVAAFAALGAGQLPVALAGTAVAGTGFVLLAATGTVDELGVVMLTLPLPALYSDDTLRVTIAAPATAAAVFAWYVRRSLTHHPFSARALPRRSGLVFLCALLVAAAFAVAPATSLRELVNLLVMAAFLFACTDMLVPGSARRDRLVIVIVAIAGVTGFFATLQALTIIPGEFPRWGTAFQRAALGFGQPNGLGLFLALVIPFAVHVRAHAPTPTARTLATAALIATGFGVVATFSRGAWLSTFLGAAILFAAGNGRRALRIWGAVLVGAIMLDIATGGAIRDTFVRTLGDWVLEQRAALALAGLAMFAEHPLVGVGPGGFAVMIEHYGAQISTLWDYQPTPHNVYIELGAETGVVGLAAYVAFMAMVLRTHAQGIRRAATRYGRHAAETSVREAAAWSVAIGVCAGMAITPFAHGTGQLLAVAIAIGCAVPEDA
jgi:O-antigen ligase